jgi:uncharacterized protein
VVAKCERAAGGAVDSSNPMNYGIVDTDSAGEGIGGGISKPPDGSGPYTAFYVNVDDVRAKLNEAEKLGGKVVMPPMQAPTGPRSRCSPTPTAT